MKKFLTILFIFTLCVIPCVLTVNGQSDVALPGESVYASPVKQKEIADGLNEYRDNIVRLADMESCILTESITPVYCIDPTEVINTGEIKLYPSKFNENGCLVCGEEGQEPEMCVAKAIDYNGLSSYDVWIRQGIYYTFFKTIGEKIEYGGWSRTSFADHLDGFNFTGGYAKDTRYVVIMGIESAMEPEKYFNYGSAFYYSGNLGEFLINLDSYDGLFYEADPERATLPPTTNNQILSVDKFIERLEALKEKRDLELELLDISQKMGLDTSEAERNFINNYNENKGSNYGNTNSEGNKKRVIQNVVHITDYIHNNEYIPFARYPQAEKLVGTRYAGIEAETGAIIETTSTETTSEIGSTTNGVDNVGSSENKYGGIIIFCAVLGGVAIGVAAFSITLKCKKKK